MSIKVRFRPARSVALLSVAVVAAGLTTVGYQAHAATPSVDLRLTAGSVEQVSEIGSHVTVNFDFHVTNEGPDALGSYLVTVESDGAGDGGQINIIDPEANRGTVCRAEAICEMTIVHALAEDAEHQFQVRLSTVPGTEYQVRVTPADGATDPRQRNNRINGTVPVPVTDLDLDFLSGELIWRSGSHVEMSYQFTVANTGPQPLTELDVHVETENSAEIRIVGPDDPHSMICRAKLVCDHRFAGLTLEPGTDLPLQIRITGPALTDGEISISPPWSTDPTPGPVVAVRLPNPSRGGV